MSNCTNLADNVCFCGLPTSWSYIGCIWALIRSYIGCIWALIMLGLVHDPFEARFLISTFFTLGLFSEIPTPSFILRSFLLLWNFLDLLPSIGKASHIELVLAKSRIIVVIESRSVAMVSGSFWLIFVVATDVRIWFRNAWDCCLAMEPPLSPYGLALRQFP